MGYLHLLHPSWRKQSSISQLVSQNHVLIIQRVDEKAHKELIPHEVSNAFPQSKEIFIKLLTSQLRFQVDNASLQILPWKEGEKM